MIADISSFFVAAIKYYTLTACVCYTVAPIEEKSNPTQSVVVVALYL